MKYDLKAVLRCNSGVIVNMASINGLRGTQFGAAYSAAKHGVLGLTRSAALEHIKDGICIDAVCPGTVQTPMISTLTGDPETAAENAAMHPIGWRANAEEVVAVVLALASEEMSLWSVRL